MMLLLDVGNSTIHWAWSDEHSLLRTQSCDHDNSLPDDLLAEWRTLERPRRVLLAHVASDGLRQLIHDWIKVTWGIAVEEIRTSAQAHGVTNAYREPVQLGVDRWLAMIGAYRQTGAAVCIVDCGTALTIDAVNADGLHCGGLIMPGLIMMRKALSREAAGINVNLTTEVVDFGLAHDTAGAVVQGTQQMLLAAIEKNIQDICRLLKCQMTVMITGGYAAALVGYLPESYRYEPDLVLQGLLLMAKDNV